MEAPSLEDTPVKENGSIDLKEHDNYKNERPETPPDGGSDGDEERTARERLKKTSIAGLAQQSADSSQSGAQHPLSQSTTMDQIPESNNGARGRPAKKRSFEDLARDDVGTADSNAVGQPPSPKSGHHKRMRSRDIASGEHPPSLNKFDKDAAGTLHEESDLEAQKSPGGPGVLVDTPSQEEMDKVRSDPVTDIDSASTATGSRQADNSSISKALESASQPKPTSGFANTSTASPFGHVQSSGQKSEEPKATSSSAFASSGLSAFASSEKSPFGNAGTTSVFGGGGGFGGTSTGGGFGSSSSGGFGSASGFAAKSSSGFGGGGGFGSSGGFGSALGAPKPFASASGFGGGAAAKPFGSVKPFGSAAKNEDENEAGSGDEGEDNEAQQVDDDQQDPRFHEQHVDTGEEGEETLFACRAKLYHFEKEWKERGVGTLKVNISYAEESLGVTTTTETTTQSEDDPEQPQFSTTRRKARLLMRADGVHRVILNSPVFKGMKFGATDGTTPTGKTMHLQGLEEGKPRGYQVKIGKEEMLKELYHRLRELEAEAL